MFGGRGTFPLTDTYLTEEMEEIGSPMHVLKGVWTSFSVQFRWGPKGSRQGLRGARYVEVARTSLYILQLLFLQIVYGY